MAFGKLFQKKESTQNSVLSVVPEFPQVEEISELSTTVQETSSTSSKFASEPFFVRIDKFNDGKVSLQSIDKGLREMGKLLEKIEEIKEKESQEIESWRASMKEVREHLSQIDEEIFNKI